MRPFNIKEFTTEAYRRVREELTPAECKAILTVISLLIIGAAAKIISTL